MPNFIRDNVTKVDRRAIPPGESETKFVRADDLNDIQDWIRGGDWYGLAAQASDPLPAGVTNYIWLKNDGTLWKTVNGSAAQLGASGAISVDSIAVSGDITSSATTATALNVPSGGIYAKYALFGDNGDTSLGVIGTTNLECLRLASQHDLTTGSNITEYADAALARTSDMRINPTADIELRSIVGAGDDFRLMCIQNVSTTKSITIRDAAAAFGTVGNRFNFPGSYDNWVLEPEAKAMFAHDAYDATNDSWKLIGWGSTQWPRLKVGRLDATVQTVTTTGAAKITVDANTSTIRFTPGSTLEITGFTGGYDGRILILHNHGTANVLIYDELDSTPADRVTCDTGGGFGYLLPKGLSLMYYDGTASRWILAYFITRQTPASLTINGSFSATSACGFQGASPIAKPTVTGSRGGAGALTSLLTAVSNYGLVTDSSTAAGTLSYPYFGDGLDLALTFDGTTTILGIVPTGSPGNYLYVLTKDICGTTITINSGVSIRFAGYRMMATVSITNNGTKVGNYGPDASGVSAGGSTGSGVIATGVSGVAGKVGPGVGTAGTASGGVYTGWATAAAAASGATGSTGQGSGGGAAGANAGGTGGALTQASVISGRFSLKTGMTGEFERGTSQLTWASSGGAGAVIGGASGNSGGTGGGGSLTYIGSPLITGTGRFTSKGGDAGPSTLGNSTGCGGSAGSGGGWIVVIYCTRTGSLTIDADGGTGASGVGTGGTGPNGGAGTVTLMNISGDGT